MRVIARLTRERDEAREALSKVDIGARAAPTNGDAMQVDNAGLPESIITKIEATQERLSKTRRKRPVPEDWATADEISTYKPTQHFETPYSGGRVFSLDATDELALVAGSEPAAGVYSLQQQRLLYSLDGDGGLIMDAVWAGSHTVIASEQGWVKVFEGTRKLSTFSRHVGEITGLSLHPSGDILASVGAEKSYALYDLENKNTITQIYTDSGMPLILPIPLPISAKLIYSPTALDTTSFHPDGHLLALGTRSGNILIYDLKSSALAATFASPPSESYPITALSFSENGTWLASNSASTSQISIWDLRKSTRIHTIDAGGPVTALAWDYSAQFLATGGPNGVTVQRYDKGSKAWSEPLKVAVPATRLAWGAQGKSLVVLDMHGVLTTISQEE